MQGSSHALSREGDTLIPEAYLEIGRQLRAAYAPIVAQPLPRETDDLVGALLVLERLRPRRAPRRRNTGRAD
jgi:hypothetical protein